MTSAFLRDEMPVPVESEEPIPWFGHSPRKGAAAVGALLMVSLVGTLAYGPVTHLFSRNDGEQGVVTARMPPKPTEASSLSSALVGMKKLGSAVQKADSSVEAEAEDTERLRLIKGKHEAEVALAEVVAEASDLKRERGENLFKARLAKDEAAAKAAALEARRAQIRLMRDRRKLGASHFKATSAKRAQGALKSGEKGLEGDTIMFVQETLPEPRHETGLMTASEIRDASSMAIKEAYGPEVSPPPTNPVKPEAASHDGQFLEEPAEFGPWLMI